MNKFKLILSFLLAIFIFCIIYIFSYNVAEPKAYDFLTKHIMVQKLPFDVNKKIYGSDDIVLVIID